MEFVIVIVSLTKPGDWPRQHFFSLSVSLITMNTNIGNYNNNWTNWSEPNRLLLSVNNEIRLDWMIILATGCLGQQFHWQIWQWWWSIVIASSYYMYMYVKRLIFQIFVHAYLTNLSWTRKFASLFFSASTDHNWHVRFHFTTGLIQLEHYHTAPGSNSYNLMTSFIRH